MTILIKRMLATFHNWDGPEKKLTFLYIFLNKWIAHRNSCKGYFDENISRFEVRLFKPFTTERMSVSQHHKPVVLKNIWMGTCTYLYILHDKNKHEVRKRVSWRYIIYLWPILFFIWQLWLRTLFYKKARKNNLSWTDLLIST